MPYRNDRTALRVRKLALENELRGLEVRAEQARHITQLERETKRELENINSILGATHRAAVSHHTRRCDPSDPLCL